MEDEAEVGSASEDEDELDAPSKKKLKAVISSDEDDDDEDEDEEKAREEMKGFIADDDDGNEDESGSASASASDDHSDGGRKKRKKKKRRRSRSRSRSDEEIDEEDMELLQENLGMKIKKQRKRIKMGSDDDEDDRDDEEDLPDLEERDETPDGHEGGHKMEAVDEDDVDDFIVGDDGQPIKKDRRKKRQHIFADSARQEAEDIFGVAFDYEEFYGDGDDDYDEEDDEDEDEDEDEMDEEERERRRAERAGRRRKKRKTKTIFEMYEPRELELRHFTEADNEIRSNDVPERMQLRQPTVASVAEASDELEREANWIFQHGFIKKAVSKQQGFTHVDCEDWKRRDAAVVEQIKVTLDFIRQQLFEVPFIAHYRKEYTPDLKINELWRVYEWDALWCKLQARKKKLARLAEQMIAYQAETICHDADAPLPEDLNIVPNDYVEKIEDIELFEELKDRDHHFKLYWGGKELEASRAMTKKKRREEKEARRLSKGGKKRKTKTITNEDGEEVEVTDEDAPSSYEEDENDDDDDLDDDDEEDYKQAKRSDSYTLAKKYGILGMASRFGLSAEQFGENLKEGYTRYEPEGESLKPLEVASQFLNDKYKDPHEVLDAAKHALATQIAKEPLVRKEIRNHYYERATIDVRPTKRGRKEIDENHDCYALKYLTEKPVRDLRDDQWLKLVQAEEQKLLTVEVTNNVRSIIDSEKFLLDEAKSRFRDDHFDATTQEWNNLREDIIDLAFNKMTYPMMKNELRIKLTREAKDFVLRECRKKLADWIRVGKYSVTFDDEDEDEWDSSRGCRVVSIMYENDINVAAYAVALTVEGEVADLIKLEHLLKRKNSNREREVKDKHEDMKRLKNFIHQRRPHCVVVGVADRTALHVQKDVEDVVSELVEGEAQFPRIKVFLLDDNLARVYANSVRAKHDFRDYPEVLRQAISLGRRMQDPLTEFSQLCGPENEILCLRYHPMQDVLSDDELLAALGVELINRVNDVGVDINECVAHSHASNLVQFVGGLGPRKGAALLKTLQKMQSSQRLENRQQLVTLCHMGPKVLINCAGFIKIDTTSLGDSEVYVEILDGSRIHNEAYEWARKMAVDALEYDEDEGNPATALEEILQEPEKLAELDLEAFAQELERQGFGKKSITLHDIRNELYHMYKDRREPFEEPSPEGIFHLVTKETPDTFFVGKLIEAVVTGFAYKKPQAEELDQAAPVRNGEDGMWQCPFCGLDTFVELGDVWNHFDANTCPGKAVGVKVRLDNGISGFIPMKNLSDSNVLNPEERVRVRQNVHCRVTKIQTERLSIECICKSSALIDREGEWKPKKDEYYDEDIEKRDSADENAKESAKRRQTYTRRVIVHPSFYNIDYNETLRLMKNMDQGEVIIRPSSKGEDLLTATWKVIDSSPNMNSDILQHVEIREQGKTNAFSLGKSLWIGNEEFEDLDEIIARHVNPMASHARDISSFKYFRDTEGGNRDKAKEMLVEERRAQPSKIAYFISASKDYAGKFMLSYMPRHSARHEFISVTPEGFRFRKQAFESLTALMKWFKDHYREAPPGTPTQSSQMTPSGGRSVNRTPYGGITPGAMSMATGTPYQSGGAVNTPYTPSGQTPFMTPYQSMTPRTGSGAVTPRTGGANSSQPPPAMAYRGSLTPSGRQPPLPRQGMPLPPPGRQTPGQGRTPGGGPGPYPSPYAFRNRTPGGGNQEADWQVRLSRELNFISLHLTVQ